MTNTNTNTTKQIQWLSAEGDWDAEGNDWDAEGEDDLDADGTDWDAEGEDEDADDKNLLYADAEAEVLRGANGEFFEARGRKKGFWSRLFSKKENANRTAEHTEQKVAQQIDASMAKQAGIFAGDLVASGVHPEVAHDAAIGRSIRISKRKKKKLARQEKSRSIPRFKDKSDYDNYMRGREKRKRGTASITSGGESSAEVESLSE